MGSVDLVESPKQVFGGLVNIVPPGVIGEVVPEWRPAKLLLEDINLVEEENNTGSHEPSRVDNRIEKQ